MHVLENESELLGHPQPATDERLSAIAPCPDLLAPAGDWACAKAAVENGADAIYFGLERFNARMRAQNFTVADLPRLMEFLHRRGVKGFVTFNILTFTEELAEAETYLRALIAAGVDAAIVQDVGICRLIRRLSPDFPIHASTQMTITSAPGLEFAGELGCSTVALARECSLNDIEKIQATASATPAASVSALPPVNYAVGPAPPLPALEVFVHGALCVAYSGQCLTSEALGGRSANRGVCAQACRLPYEMICDGRPVPLGDRRYLLSPQDLAGLEVLPELIRLGVRTLKIEGRLKSPEYVANITRIYREALDALFRPIGPAAESEKSTDTPASAAVQYRMEMSFSRGLYTGWFKGINNRQLVHARFSKKRGVYLGQVSQIQRHRVTVRLLSPLKPGDGVVFEANQPDRPEQGGRVYTLQQHGQDSQIGFGREGPDLHQVQVGARMWKTSDPELERRWRQTFAGDTPRFQRPVRLAVYGRLNEPLTIIVRDDFGQEVKVASTQPLAQAATQPLATERLRAHLGRLGGTPFCLAELRNHLEGALILPISELNQLRRLWVSRLDALRAQPRRWTLNPPEALTAWTPGPVQGISLDTVKAQRRTPAAESSADNPVRARPGQGAASGQDCPRSVPELIVLVRSMAQLEAALGGGIRTIYCELEDPKAYREAVQRVHRAPPASMSPAASCTATIHPELWVAPPRITKPGEDWILRQVQSSDADGILIRNYDHLRFFAGWRCIGDFSLNIANPLSAEYFIRRFGLERVTASYDLNAAQLEVLLQAAPPEWFEITIHQHMPMFHMEHCVFCAFLSTGTDYTNCGRPCEKHQVRLRDRVGAEHPVKADAGCRNTVFNALAQTGAEAVGRFAALGVRALRIEFLDEGPEAATQTIAQYRRLMAGEISGRQLWRDLKLLNHLGVTRGPRE